MTRDRCVLIYLDNFANGCRPAHYPVDQRVHRIAGVVSGRKPHRRLDAARAALAARNRRSGCGHPGGLDVTPEPACLAAAILGVGADMAPHVIPGNVICLTSLEWSPTGEWLAGEARDGVRERPPRRPGGPRARDPLQTSIPFGRFPHPSIAANRPKDTRPSLMSRCS